MERNQKRSMIGEGASAAAATRSCHASCSSSEDDHATWWTVPAPPMPRSAGASSYAYSPPRVGPRASHASSPVGRSRASPRAARGSRSGDAVRAHGVEALERVLGRDLGMLGDERLVVDGRDHEPMPRPSGSSNADALVVA